MSTIYIVLGIVGLIILYFISVYNSFVVLRARIKEALSSIDVQLKRRTDLIPNLVETVKGYAKHEKSVFENVTKARSAILSAQNMEEKMKADAGLTQALKSLFAVAENYPQLKANENFLELQKQLEDTEDKIAYSRQFYNSNVLDYNTKVQSFPSNIVANLFSFGKEKYFEIGESDRKPVKVEF